ncbi:MAG: DUF3151 family protein [Leifsonia sp.]
MTGENLPPAASAPDVDSSGEPETATSSASSDASESTSIDEPTGASDAVVVVADDEVVRTLIGSVHREALPGFVLAHAPSPLAWAELADIAHSEGRELDAYAYATVAHQRGLELLVAAGWSDGERIAWTEAANQAVLRAAYALRRAAAAIGLVYEADALSAFLESADPDAVSRIESEHTATQLITIIPPEATAPAVPPVTEAFVIRGED